MARALGHVERPFGLVECSLGLDQERAAGLGQAYAAVVAPHKLHPEASLELLEVLGQCRLREVEPRGGAPKVQLLRQHDERPHVAQLERPVLSHHRTR